MRLQTWYAGVNLIYGCPLFLQLNLWVSIILTWCPLFLSIIFFMGVMTGTMGGIFRDVLCNEQPVVFHSPLHATVSWGGSLMFIGLIHYNLDITLAAIIAGLSIFITRLLAIYYNLTLPKFRFKT